MADYTVHEEKVYVNSSLITKQQTVYDTLVGKKDEFDIIKENKYHQKILESRRKIDLDNRPDFMEPIK